MRLKVKLILLSVSVLLLAFTAAHKFYVSVTNVDYSEKDKALQITSRIFIDDFEYILKERYDFTAKLATKKEHPKANDYIDRYLKSFLEIKINGKPVPLNFLGKEYDVDIMKCYIEVENIDAQKIQSIEVSNKVLFDAFDDQQNVVHIRLKDDRKSFIFIKGNHKGMLNF